MVYHSIYNVSFMILSHGTVQLFIGVSSVEDLKLYAWLTILLLLGDH